MLKDRYKDGRCYIVIEPLDSRVYGTPARISPRPLLYVHPDAHITFGLVVSYVAEYNMFVFMIYTFPWANNDKNIIH